MSASPSLVPARAAGNIQGIVILMASVMPIMAVISLVPVLPLLMREFSGVAGSEFLVPMALTVPALCVALFSPVAGWLSDRLGRKHLLVSALVFYALSGVLPWFLNDLVAIIAARFVLGLVEAIIMTVATALVGDYFTGAKREKWIALQIAVGSFASVVLIAISGGLAEMFGSRGPFLLYLLALPTALAAALVLFEPVAPSADPQKPTDAFPYRIMLPLALITLFVGIIFYTSMVQLGPILELSGPVSPGTIGLVGALGNLAVCLGAVIFHRFKHAAGPRLLATGLAIAAAGYAGAGLASSFALVAGFTVLAAIGNGVMLPNMLAWAMRSVPAPMRGRGMGLWTGSFFLAQFLAPMVIASAVEVTGAMAPALLTYAMVAAAAAATAAAVNLRRIVPKPSSN